MKMKRYWHLTALLLLFGQYYYKETWRSVGYFTADAYCNNFAKYLSKRLLNKADVLKYVHPLAKHFLPRELKKVHCKSQTKALNREHYIHDLTKAFQIFCICLVAIVYITILYLGNEDSKKKIIAKNELKTIYAQIKLMERNLDDYDSSQKSMENRLEIYNTDVNPAKYNETLKSYEDLKAMTEDAYLKYRRLVEEYNKRLYEVNRHRYR